MCETYFLHVCSQLASYTLCLHQYTTHHRDDDDISDDFTQQLRAQLEQQQQQAGAGAGGGAGTK